MRRVIKYRNFWVMLGADALLILFSFYFAYFLRFEGIIPEKEMERLLQSLIWVIPVKLGCFFFFNLYSGMWRYTGIREMLDLVRACLTASAIIITVLLITIRVEGFPRSIFIIDFLLTLLLVGGLRPGEKLYEELTSDGEEILSTDHDKITVIRPNNNWNGPARHRERSGETGGHESQEAFCGWLNPILQKLYALAEKQDGCGIREQLKELVPEYTPQENECVL